MEGRLLAGYLFTNPKSHVSGIYHLPEYVVLHETGIQRRTLDTLWDTLSGIGFSHRDATLEIVWVVRMLDHQGRGAKNATSAAKQLESLHGTWLIKPYLEEYPQVAAECSERILLLSDTLSYTLSDTLSHRVSGSSVSGSESGSVAETGSGTGTGGARGGVRRPKPPTEPPGFAPWYETQYPRRVKRPDAAKAFRQVTPDPGALRDGTLRWVRFWTERDTPPDRIPYPASFLRARQWEDQTGADLGNGNGDRPKRKVQPGACRCGCNAIHHRKDHNISNPPTDCDDAGRCGCTGWDEVQEGELVYRPY